MKFNRFYLLQLLIFAGLATFSFTIPAVAQFKEEFESTTPTWERRETDCIISDSKWTQRRSNDIEARNRFESFDFQNGTGTQILVSHDVPPAFVIPELVPSVRVLASRPGVRLMARVVLPYTPSPNGEGPMTTVLTGPRYKNVGKWETLSFDLKQIQNEKDLKEKLKVETWLLRRKFGTKIDIRDAYVDKVVLNLYTGAGNTKVKIDDLELKGIVSADKIAQTVKTVGSVKRDENLKKASSIQDVGKRPSIVQRDGSVLLVKKAPFFPRIVQHNGEPFNYLKAIGFNVLELKATATADQLRQAHDLEMWLVCPPPKSVGINPIDFQFDRVLAWKVGDKLTGKDISVTQQRIREIRESDQREGRPIVANIQSSWSQLTQLTDVVSIGVEPLGSSFLASQYGDWIRQRRHITGNSKPIWADIQTELSRSLTSQIGILAKKSPPIPVEPQQIKFLVYEAIAGGARGLRFLSRTRLDGIDPVARLRAKTIEWINAEIEQIEPWAGGGAVMDEVPTTQPQLKVTAINTNRSRLLLIQRPTHHEQYLAGDVPISSIGFNDPQAASNSSAYLLSESGLVSLPNSRGHAGTQIQIDNCPYSAAVVLTQNPLVVNKLTKSYERVGKQTLVQMRNELTQQWMAIMQLIDQQMGRMGKSSSAASGAFNQAANEYRNAQTQLNGSSQQAAIDFLNRADERLAFMRRDMITGPLGMFQSKTSTPFVSHTSLIPLHWELANRLRDVSWNPNGLAGGDFENLGMMMSNGWKNQRLEDNQFVTRVELSEAAKVDGAYGLKLSVAAQSQPPAVVDSTPLWISTPEIPIRGGQLVRIHGWVHVPQVIRGTHDGLMITDTLGGPDMAERIPVTKGWQEFSLYRGASKDGTIQVKFSLNGMGEALLDEVTIRMIELPNSVQRQARKE